MAEIKNAIDKTEELARKIWLAGLGAYGHGLNNIHEGYDKMSDSTRRYFEDLVERGTKIEAEAKTKLDKTGDKLKEAGEKLKTQSEKLKAQGEKLKIQGKSLKKDAVKANITAKVDEIRGKVSSKLTMPTMPSMPSIPSFGKEEKLAELSSKLDELIGAVSALVSKEVVEEKAAPAPAPKKTTRKPAAEKPVAAKPAVEKPVAEKPATATE
ncbi:phasin family protein [Porticoccus sp.]